MNRKGFGTILLFIIVIILIVIVGVIFYRITEHHTTQPSQTVLNNTYVAVVASDRNSIEITNGSTLVVTIVPSDIPSFDENNYGEPADPATDYIFSPLVALSTSTKTVYFAVENEDTAGNANADRALFSYDINTRKLSLLDNESFTTSFDIFLGVSPDGRFLVYDWGEHAGDCFNTIGLDIYDLKNQTNTAGLFAPDYGIEQITFDHWVGNSSFIYNEEKYPDGNTCTGSEEEVSSTIIQKTYTITE